MLFFDRDAKITEQVLFFPVKNGQVVMGKKIARIGKGCWNGFGGNVKPNETKVEALLREFYEETKGAQAIRSSLFKNAIILVKKRPIFRKNLMIKLHVFTGWYTGEISDSDEIAGAREFEIKRLPHPLMPGDEKWLPLVLDGGVIVGTLNLDLFPKRIRVKFEFKYHNLLPLD